MRKFSLAYHGTLTEIWSVFDLIEDIVINKQNISEKNYCYWYPNAF